ncbi:MAG: 4Fe-4S dicluster domain-containing protein [Lachnospiraceae bacterium]|nr:4Fe-4S dicluster domain-containing protein [Lachnospiraceae bacterium]
MSLEELKNVVRKSGVVGAGGAGFPSYAKMTDKADTVILNCVECEPLLKLHRQLLAMHTNEIVRMLDEVRETFGAKEAVIGIKSEYTETVNALKEVLGDYPNVRIHELKAAYPMGDEVVLIYEVTGRVISPGGLPIDENVVVYNVETMYNMYCGKYENRPVTDKLVSIVGEIDTPRTLRLPLGMKVGDAVKAAGNLTTKEPAYLMGGPMMGKFGTENTVITKTTNAIIILPKDHKLVLSANKDLKIEKRRASSACCQCRTCTDLCSRHVLGHPIEPHRIMRAVANSDTDDLVAFIGALYCSGCGICEKYACPQGLSPRTLIQEFKGALRAGGIKPEKVDPAPVVSGREERKVPVHRLAHRLGLYPYDKDAPIDDTPVQAERVEIPLSQHIGAPAKAVVKPGDKVSKGQMIGEAAEGLSVNIHCSIDGVVEAVNDKSITVRNSRN